MGDISIKTDAGLITAHVTKDELYPGISVSFTPAGCDKAIDLFVAESPAGEGLVNQVPGTLNLYLYADVWSDEWTDKVVVLPEEAKKAVNAGRESA